MTQLASRAVAGGKITIATQMVRFGVQFAGIVVLGRLLEPADFGLLAMVTAIVGIGEVLRDFGLSTAAVQTRTLSHAQASNLFWMNSAIGAMLATACLVLSGPISDLYGDERIAGLCAALAVTFVLNGMQTQFQAQLVRGMQYWKLTLTDLTSQLCGLAAGIFGALSGIGYWALAAQIVTQSIVLVILRWATSSWHPGLPKRNAGMRGLFTFGRNLVGTQLMVYFSANVDTVLIGRLHGAFELGFYQRAYQLLMMPLNQILAPLNNVALPVLSKLQDRPREFSNYVTRAQLTMLYPVMMIFATLAVTAERTIPLVFGEQWAPAVTIFQVLAIGGIFQAANYVSYWVFLSLGLTGSHFRYSMLGRGMLIVALVIGAQFGIMGVAVGYSLSMILNWPLALWWLRDLSPVQPRTLARQVLKILSLGVVVSSAGLVANSMVDGLGDLRGLVVVVAVVLLVAAMLSALPPVRSDLSDLQRVLRHS